MRIFWLGWNAKPLIKEAAPSVGARVCLHQQTGSKESATETTFNFSAVSQADLSILKLIALAKMLISFLTDPRQRNRALSWGQKAWVLILSLLPAH